jgi:uncharacterized protein DUF1439
MAAARHVVDEFLLALTSRCGGYIGQMPLPAAKSPPRTGKDSPMGGYPVMSKRKIAWIVVALVGLLSAIGLLWSMFGSDRLTFTAEELQSRLNQQLPRTVRDVTIERVDVALADNRLALRIAMQARVLQQPVSATVSARGVPRYAAQETAMYFDADDIKIEQVAIAGRTVVGEEGGRATNTVRSALQGVAESGIKAYLAARPVYRFKDDIKGVVLKAALVDVAIEQNTLMVTFSLWNLTMTAAIFALILIILVLVIYWLIRHPRWGLNIVDAVVNAP